MITCGRVVKGVVMHCVRRGFTLVELLVVVAIISVLAALLLPSLDRAMASAKLSYCLNNVRQMMSFTQQYADDNRNWVPMWATATGDLAFVLYKNGYIDGIRHTDTALSSLVAHCPIVKPNRGYAARCSFNRYYNYTRLNGGTVIEGLGSLWTVPSSIVNSRIPASRYLFIGEASYDNSIESNLIQLKSGAGGYCMHLWHQVGGNAGNAAFADGHGETMDEAGAARYVPVGSSCRAGLSGNWATDTYIPGKFVIP